jgi:hypothetical protein
MSSPIAILVPSRGRPHNIARLKRVIDATAASPEEVTLYVRLDDDDPAGVHAYEDALRDTPGLSSVVLRTGPRTRLRASWDEMAALAVERGAEYLAPWGDDVVPETPDLDEILTQRLDRDGPGFVYGRDGVWDRTFDRDVPGHLVLPTACIMQAEVFKALGWIGPAQLTHLCIDLAWRDLGVATGCLFYEASVMIRHRHRIAGAPDDQTYRDANDDEAQKRGDMLGYNSFRNGPDFVSAMAALRELREERSNA